VAILPDIMNLRYGSDHLRQVLDVYLPDESFAPAPVVIFIHGGGWEGGDKIGAIFAAAKLLPRGFAVVAINYRLSQHAIFPAQLHDAKAAVRWVRAHAEDFGFDVQRIGVWGASAGGHLAALLGMTAGLPDAEGEVGYHLDESSRVHAVVDYYGPTDLLHIALDVTDPPGTTVDFDNPESMVSRLFGFHHTGEGIGVLRQRQSEAAAPIAEKLALVHMANPMAHVSPDDPPFFIAHGAADDVVPLGQSTRLTEALSAIGLEPISLTIPQAGHGLPPDVDDEAIEFLYRVLVGHP